MHCVPEVETAGYVLSRKSIDNLVISTKEKSSQEARQRLAIYFAELFEGISPSVEMTNCM
jgi:hypothetical protein